MSMPGAHQDDGLSAPAPASDPDSDLDIARRVQRLRDLYRIDDTALAATIGVSTPMLGLLASGQRDRIANPAAYDRLTRLEELGRSPEIQAGDDESRKAALAEVGRTARFRSRQRIEPTTSARDTAAVYLGGIAEPADLELAAAAVPSTELAELLLEAVRRAR